MLLNVLFLIITQLFLLSSHYDSNRALKQKIIVEVHKEQEADKYYYKKEEQWPWGIDTCNL